MSPALTSHLMQPDTWARGPRFTTLAESLSSPTPGSATRLLILILTLRMALLKCTILVKAASMGPALEFTEMLSALSTSPNSEMASVSSPSLELISMIHRTTRSLTLITRTTHSFTRATRTTCSISGSCREQTLFLTSSIRRCWQKLKPFYPTTTLLSLSWTRIRANAAMSPSELIFSP